MSLFTDPFWLFIVGLTCLESCIHGVLFVHGQNKINRLGRLGNFSLYWMAASIIVVSDSDR